jgi:hypothetical protein
MKNNNFYFENSLNEYHRYEINVPNIKSFEKIEGSARIADLSVPPEVFPERGGG